MTLDLSFTSNRDLDDAVIEAAFEPARQLTDPPPSDRVLALILRMVEVARPEDGAGRILDVLARLARAEWIEGGLDVLLQQHEEGTVLDVLVFDGLSYQRSFQTLLVPVGLPEFVEWFAMNQRELSPLALVRDVPGEELNLAALDGPQPTHSSRPVFQPEVERKPTLRLPRVTVPEEAIPTKVHHTPPAGQPAQAQPAPTHLAKTVRFDAVQITESPDGSSDVDEDWD